ncbi:MAG: DegQ family serine endoprotease, partial [Methyloligellaceae bacterium]
LSYSPVVKRAAPAVVNVYVRRKVKVRSSPFFEDPFFRRFFGGGFGMPRERVESSLGSGVIVSPDGVIVTNHHVIKARGEAEIKIALADKREFPAKVILKDERTDLAVLRLDAPGVTFPYLDFEDSEGLEVGDIVLAIGNPFGVGQTVTSGIVSALARTKVGVSDYKFFIQTDAAINPGNSGGALVDMEGQLVGVNTAIYSRTGGSHGIGFAIPSNMVRQVVLSALRGKRVKRPWFGAKLQNVTPDIADSLGLDRPAGALVKQVHKSSPAHKADLKPGDVIVQVSGKNVSDPQAFRYRFSTRPIGGSVKLVVIRSGGTLDILVPLEEAPEVPPRNETEIAGRNPFSGARVANLSPALTEELSIDEDAYGVVVLDVRRDTPASNTRFLRRNDIIVALNGERINSVRQLSDIVKQQTRRWRVSLKRSGRILNVVIGG